MPTKMPSNIPRRGVWATIVVAVVALAGCSDNSVDPSFEDVAAGDVEAGTIVTIDGEAVDLLNAGTLLLERDGERILITDVSESGELVVQQGDIVVVTGPVGPLGDGVLRDAGVDGLVDREDLADDYVAADLVREQLEAREEGPL